MKKMKKLASLVLALAMALTLAVPAMAANADLTGHTYKAYQIFSGTQATEGDASQLGNIQWGSGINDTTFLAALKADETIGNAFTDCTTAADVADAMKGWADKSPEAEAFAKVAYANKAGDGVACQAGTTSLAAGYYLVVDVTQFGENATNTVYNLALLQLTKKGTFDIDPKVDIPGVDKEVWDEAGEDDNATDPNWGETADHYIGEHFQFRLTATIPAGTMTNFDSYKIVFNDTMSEGITFVRLDSVTINNDEVEAGKYTETATSQNEKAGLSWSLTIADVKTAVSDLNTKEAVTVVVTYTAKLNDKAKIGNDDSNENRVNLEYSNNPNVDGDGKTPDDIVWVFTYKMENTKTDGANQPLQGATFAIKNTEGKYYGGVKEGVVQWVTSADPAKDAAVYKVTSNASGDFTVSGLDVGTYILTEVVTPAGYNTCEDVTVVISAVHRELDDTINAETVITMTQDGTTTNKITVVNNSGATLPETGGMGTTLFYALGAVLVIGAGVAMVTKKRMA